MAAKVREGGKEGDSGSLNISWGIGSKVPTYHLCPDSGGRDMDSNSWWEEQQSHVAKGWAIGDMRIIVVILLTIWFRKCLISSVGDGIHKVGDCSDPKRCSKVVQSCQKTNVHSNWFVFELGGYTSCFYSPSSTWATDILGRLFPGSSLIGGWSGGDWAWLCGQWNPERRQHRSWTGLKSETWFNYWIIKVRVNRALF